MMRYEFGKQAIEEVDTTLSGILHLCFDFVFDKNFFFLIR